MGHPMFDLQASLDSIPRQYAKGAIKITEDIARYQVIVDRVKPDVIVEMGAFSGKCALHFARTARCRVVTVDVTPCIDPETRTAWDGLPIHLIVGNTIDLVTVQAVGDFIEDATEELGRPARVMVSLDSDHSAAHVAEEIRLYGPMVTSGSYMVVEDGLLRWMPFEERRHYVGDPLDAIEALLALDDRWEVDVELENMFPATQHPSGWLRRR